MDLVPVTIYKVKTERLSSAARSGVFAEVSFGKGSSFNAPVFSIRCERLERDSGVC